MDVAQRCFDGGLQVGLLEGGRSARAAAEVLTAGVVRPVVDADYTATVGLDRAAARALVAAAVADPGRGGAAQRGGDPAVAAQRAAGGRGLHRRTSPTSVPTWRIGCCG
jgi:hypothetical protein